MHALLKHIAELKRDIPLNKPAACSQPMHAMLKHQHPALVQIGGEAMHFLL
jgi:hypothetical protein